MARAAAFFDLDRTLLRRSSALALAGPFRRHGLISRRQLVKAAFWQILFAARGASHETVRKAAEDGLVLLRGMTPQQMRDLVAGALEDVLRPLVYGDALRVVRSHQERGEPTYVVSATLQEVVETIADDLGFDGALGTLCEVGPDGTYTGRALRALHAEAKADALRELAGRERFELSRCWAYSDSHTDLPFLEVVGHPVAVNPDRRLRQVAAQRGWRIVHFRERHDVAA
jgi:HAD superfamily hydrolase (TIGR01490 family)